MAKFTIEEINMLQYCETKDKKGMTQELLQLLCHCDGDMKELVSNTINKLEQADEMDMAALLVYPAEISEEDQE